LIALALVAAWVLRARPLPPDLRARGGLVATLGAPVLAVEDWLDAKEGLGVPCEDRAMRTQVLDGVSFELPRCFTLQPAGPRGVYWLRDPGLGNSRAVLQMMPRRDPRMSLLTTAFERGGAARLPSRGAFQTWRLTDGENADEVAVAWLSTSPEGAVLLRMVVPSAFRLSPKVTRHLAALDDASTSLRLAERKP
jgi:hypothetical protein